MWATNISTGVYSYVVVKSRATRFLGGAAPGATCIMTEAWSDGTNISVAPQTYRVLLPNPIGEQSMFLQKTLCDNPTDYHSSTKVLVNQCSSWFVPPGNILTTAEKKKPALSK